jgi:hypothetical protein
MMRAITACLFVVGCAPGKAMVVPEASPLPKAEPVTAPQAPAVEAEPPVPVTVFHVERQDEVELVSREGEPCPWVEYASAWNSLRFRSDRAECVGVTLSGSAELAAQMIDGLARELGPAFAPVSFGMNDYPEMYERIARSAATSPLWDPVRGKPKKGSINQVVVELAPDAQAFYPEVVALFAARKLNPRFSSTEKVLVSAVADTPFAPALLGAGLKKTAKVPYGSVVWFHLDAP